MNPVRAQYEAEPYPPISRFALPRANEGSALRFEIGTNLCFGIEQSHAGKRILVAGCGTLEPLVVAQTHPRAAEIVSVDLSQNSLRILRSRVRLAQLARLSTRLHPFRTNQLAPLKLVCADLIQWEPGAEGYAKFDYILASNMIHHTADPASLLARMASWLAPNGILRVVTYPSASRIFMRETSLYLRRMGLTPDTPRLLKKARRAIALLPASSAVRSCFESQPETSTRAGLIDAFFNACENPLAPLQWQNACRTAGLQLMAESQTETSRSEFLCEILPATRELSRWMRLQIMDDLLELCANPVLWLKKASSRDDSEGFPFVAFQGDDLNSEIGWGLRRAEGILRRVDLSLDQAIEAIRTQVGPRVSAPPKQRVLPGLSILDYDYRKLLGSLKS